MDKHTETFHELRLEFWIGKNGELMRGSLDREFWDSTVVDPDIILYEIEKMKFFLETYPRRVGGGEQ